MLNPESVILNPERVMLNLVQHLFRASMFQHLRCLKIFTQICPHWIEIVYQIYLPISMPIL
jgi:hypothetical protein